VVPPDAQAIIRLMNPQQKKLAASFLILAVGAMITLAFRVLGHHRMVELYLALAIGALGVVMYVIKIGKPDA
jgi:hypothetical protein